MRGWLYPLFQLTNRRFIAADYSGDIDLAEAQIEPPFANGFADCSWLGGIAFPFVKYGPMGQRKGRIKALEQASSSN